MRCLYLQYNAIEYDTTERNAMPYNIIYYSTIQYCTIPYNTIQYITIQYNYNVLYKQDPWLVLSYIKHFCCWSYASKRCSATIGEHAYLLKATILRLSLPKKVAPVFPRTPSSHHNCCKVDAPASSFSPSCSNTLGNTTTEIAR